MSGQERQPDGFVGRSQRFNGEVVYTVVCAHEGCSYMTGRYSSSVRATRPFAQHTSAVHRVTRPIVVPIVEEEE